MQRNPRYFIKTNPVKTGKDFVLFSIIMIIITIIFTIMLVTYFVNFR